MEWCQDQILYEVENWQKSSNFGTTVKSLCEYEHSCINFLMVMGKNLYCQYCYYWHLSAFWFLYASGRIPCPHPGRIWLEQRGLQRALYWHIEARVVLDLQEFADSVRILRIFNSTIKSFEFQPVAIVHVLGGWNLKFSRINSALVSIIFISSVCFLFRKMIGNFAFLWLMEISRSLRANGLLNLAKGNVLPFFSQFFLFQLFYIRTFQLNIRFHLILLLNPCQWSIFLSSFLVSMC